MSHHIDPVCGKRVNVNKAHIVVSYEGVDYYLCCPLCQKTFEQNPQQYANTKSKHKRR